MWNNIKIRNFKSLSAEDLQLSPLTVLTGRNSTGKSSLLQSILAILSYADPVSKKIIESSGLSYDFKYDNVRNKLDTAKDIEVCLRRHDGHVASLKVSMSDYEAALPEGLSLEHGICYLSANRSAFDQLEIIPSDSAIGIMGEYVFGLFHKNKTMPLAEKYAKYKESLTLSAQVNYWLKYILDLDIELDTREINSNQVFLTFSQGNVRNISASQLGVGVASVAKAIAACLLMQEGQLLMIENPELHLHPAAQSRLAEFMTFIAAQGTQLIVETHCEHFINRLQYEILKRKISHDDVLIYYKDDVTFPFIRIGIHSNGRLDRDFPTGFFDATLLELIEIG